MAESVAFSAGPYHILSYGTLLGTSFFHSFVTGPVMFRRADRQTFSNVQTGLFPIYFGLQTVLPVILALTFPGNTLLGFESGVHGLLDKANRYHSLLPIVAIFVTGLANLVVLLPNVSQVMKDRKGQAKRDGKDWYAGPPHSDEMRALNKKFGILHGISSLLNLTTFISAVVYGFTLGARLL